jgi:hypothetical protein
VALLARAAISSCRRLVAVTREPTLDSHGGRLWLLEQLHNQLDRRLAIVALGSPMEPLLHDNLVIMLRHVTVHFIKGISWMRGAGDWARRGQR